MNRLRHHRRKLLLVVLILIVIGGGIVTAMVVFKSAQKPSNQPSAQQPAARSDTTLACIETLPDKTLIGQKLMTAVYKVHASEEQPLIARYQLGGVILMDEVEAVTIASLSNGAKIAPTIATDQEGGPVQRFTIEGDVPSAETVAGTMSAEQAYTAYSDDAAYLKSLGITTNFAPVVDVISTSPSPLPERMYSSTPSTVITYAKQSILAQQHAGIAPVIKHFPGLGSANGNTDFGSATTASLAALKTRDLLPYQSLATLQPDAMVSNAIAPDLTNGQPAVWSPEAVTLLRSYGYQNAVIYSDSLTAQALPGSLADAVVKAWQAGIDVALIVQTKQQTPGLAGMLDDITARIETALQNGELHKKELAQSVERVLARKNVDACRLNDDR